MLKKKISPCDLIYPVILAVLLFFKSYALYSKMDLAEFPVAFSIATSAIFLAVYQPEADRAAHKAVPIQVALTLAGSIESIVITVNVQV